MLLQVVLATLLGLIANLVVLLVNRYYLDPRIREAIAGLDRITQAIDRTVSKRRRQKKAKVTSKTLSKYRYTLFRYNMVKSALVLASYFAFFFLVSSFFSGTVILPIPASSNLTPPQYIRFREGGSLVYLLSFLLFLSTSLRQPKLPEN
jgi:hypothetical protein